MIRLFSNRFILFYRGKGVGKLSKAVESIGGNKSVSGLHCGYADTGLTGAFIVCDADIAGQVRI